MRRASGSGFGRLGERGPEDGPKLMVVPGFLANDRTTLGLQRALAEAGYRVTGWGLGLNTGVQADTLDRLAARIEAFGGGGPVILVGWSLGGIYRARGRQAPPRAGREGDHAGLAFLRRPARQQCLAALRMGRRPSGRRPADQDRPRPRSRRCRRSPSGRAGTASSRSRARAAQPGESDRQVEIDCSHMGFAVSGRAYPQIVAAIRAFS